MKILKWILKTRPFCKTWKVVEHKYFELQIDWRGAMDEWFYFNIETRSDCDHAGVYFGFAFMNLFYVGLTFYDSRHKDRDEMDHWFDDYQELLICGNPQINPAERAYYAIYYEDQDTIRIFWGWNGYPKPEGVYFDGDVGKRYKLKYLTAEGLSKQITRPPEDQSNATGKVK